MNYVAYEGLNYYVDRIKCHFLSSIAIVSGKKNISPEEIITETMRYLRKHDLVESVPVVHVMTSEKSRWVSQTSQTLEIRNTYRV